MSLYTALIEFNEQDCKQLERAIEVASSEGCDTDFCELVLEVMRMTVRLHNEALKG